jgi:hypothetical protein
VCLELCLININLSQKVCFSKSFIFKFLSKVCLANFRFFFFLLPHQSLGRFLIRPPNASIFAMHPSNFQNFAIRSILSQNFHIALIIYLFIIYYIIIIIEGAKWPDGQRVSYGHPEFFKKIKN